MGSNSAIVAIAWDKSVSLDSDIDISSSSTRLAHEDIRNSHKPLCLRTEPIHRERQPQTQRTASPASWLYIYERRLLRNLESATQIDDCIPDRHI